MNKVLKNLLNVGIVIIYPIIVTLLLVAACWGISHLSGLLGIL